jgi:hypothetical protein
VERRDTHHWAVRNDTVPANSPASGDDGYRCAPRILRYFVDCALVWLAGRVNCRRILTLDRKDFEIFRLPGNKRFEIIEWMSV